MTTEEDFRAYVRKLVRAGQYPHHSMLLGIRSRSVLCMRSGLSADETKWRRQEVEAAGFDWEASKLARSLVKRSRR